MNPTTTSNSPNLMNSKCVSCNDVLAVSNENNGFCIGKVKICFREIGNLITNCTKDDQHINPVHPMNIFRLLGDFSHLAAIIILLLKIWTTRSCAGVSGKSVLLYAIVFTCRYLDLFVHYVSLYNSVMKVIYLISTYGTIYLIYVKFKSTYDRNHDSFRIELLILPSIALALIWNHEFSVLEILWTFSIYLESVAILPQLYMVTRTGEAETITSHYLFALGIYRFFYILNWTYRYYMENYLDWISIISGVIQTILYCDFFYLYITRVLRGRRIRLGQIV